MNATLGVRLKGYPLIRGTIEALQSNSSSVIRCIKSFGVVKSFRVINLGGCGCGGHTIGGGQEPGTGAGVGHDTGGGGGGGDGGGDGGGG